MTTTATAPASGAGGRPVAAMLLVLGSCSSLQGGAALAIRLFPVTGTAGATLLRLGLSAALLLAVARPRVRSWTAAQWRAVLLYGVSLAGTNGFFYAALARLPLGTAVTIQFLGPLTLAAALSRRARDTGWVLLAVAGVLTLGLADGHGAGGRPLDPVGVALVLVSAAFWALYIVAGARASTAVPGRGGLAVGLTAGALVLLPLGAAGAAHVAGRPHLLLLALGTAVLASVVPYTLELAALRRAPRRVFGILLSLEPAVAMLAGWLLLGQRPAALGVAAAALVVVASTGSALGARPPQAEAAQAEPPPDEGTPDEGTQAGPARAAGQPAPAAVSAPAPGRARRPSPGSTSPGRPERGGAGGRRYGSGERGCDAGMASGPAGTGRRGRRLGRGRRRLPGRGGHGPADRAGRPGPVARTR